MKKIMIIDDDVYIGNMLEETLEKRGFGDCIEAVWGIGRKNRVPRVQVLLPLPNQKP